MSHPIHFQGPFIKRWHALVPAGNAPGDITLPNGDTAPNTITWARLEGSPLYDSASPNYSSYSVKSPVRRTGLIIQNNGTADVAVILDVDNWSVTSGHIVLAPKQSISFDNYNGGFITGDGILTVLESFA